MLRSLIAAAAALAFVAAPARAELVTVPTAAGINIKVAKDVAAKFQGFIRDVVADGYRPKRIHCFSLSKSHVRHSAHKSGRACDFDQRGWGLTDRFMYHVRAIAEKWGLRDGCEFRDWGHIDARRSNGKPCPTPGRRAAHRARDKPRRRSAATARR